MERYVRGTLEHDLLGNQGFKDRGQLVDSASRDTGFIVEDVDLSIDFNKLECISDLVGDAVVWAEQRYQKLDQPFVRSLNMDRKLSDNRCKGMGPAWFPINLEQPQLEPVSQSLVHMISCREAVYPEFCQIFADRLCRLAVHYADAVIRRPLG